MILHTSPAVPGQKAVQTYQENGSSQEEKNPDLDSPEQVCTKIIDD
jgi:hypothetical protein